MEFTKDILNEITRCGRYDYSPRQIAIVLDLTLNQEKILHQEMENPDSVVARAYEKGKLQAREETIEHLEDTVAKGEEGAGEAAKAIGYLRRRNKEDEIRKEYFGI
jgi:hypothetical protein